MNDLATVFMHMHANRDLYSLFLHILDETGVIGQVKKLPQQMVRYIFAHVSNASNLSKR